MLDIHHQDQETIEQIKAFWARYGNWIAYGLLIASLIFLVIQYLNYHHTQQKMSASIKFQRLIDQPQMPIKEQVDILEELKTNYKNTAYADLAALWLAKYELNNQQPADAIKQLNDVIKHDRDSALVQVAKLRLARIYLWQKNYNEALKLLKNPEEPTFKAINDELLGDTYMALNNHKAATEAYASAIKALKAETVRPILMIKFNEAKT